MSDIIDAQAGAAELRSGTAPWVGRPPRATPVFGSIAVDVAVIGGGVTGSLTAEVLTRRGRSVVVVDRAVPGRVSTAASTAMLMWEIDTPLVELADRIGFERAADVYRRSLAAVGDLTAAVEALGIACEMRPRASLQLAGRDSGFGDLVEEAACRARAGLPGLLLDAGGLAERFRLSRSGGLLSPGGADCDPMALAAGMLSIAVARGARLIDDEALAFTRAGDRVEVALGSGHVVAARDVVLATGYVIPDFLPVGRHRVVSTWCFATRPQRREALWPEEVLLWETATPYLYARTTADGRIVCGGEDRITVDAQDREGQTERRLASLVAKSGELWPAADLTPSHVWSAEFGETDDGLPMIGPVPGHPGLWAAYGYGGNGITFSHMAAHILAAAIGGETRPWFADFAVDRTT